MRRELRLHSCQNKPLVPLEPPVLVHVRAYGTERSKRPVEISANPLWGESASRTRAASISPQRRHLDLAFHLRLDQRDTEASCCRPDISESFSPHCHDVLPVDPHGEVKCRNPHSG